MQPRIWVCAFVAAGAAVLAPTIAVERSEQGIERLQLTAEGAAQAQKRERRRDRVEDRIEDRADERRRETRQQARRVARRTARRVTRRHEYFNSLPSGCDNVILNGYSYFYCGGVYYEEALDENDVTVYVIVNP